MRVCQLVLKHPQFDRDYGDSQGIILHHCTRLWDEDCASLREPVRGGSRNDAREMQGKCTIGYSIG